MLKRSKNLKKCIVLGAEHVSLLRFGAPTMWLSPIAGVEAPRSGSMKFEAFGILSRYEWHRVPQNNLFQPAFSCTVLVPNTLCMHIMLWILL